MPPVITLEPKSTTVELGHVALMNCVADAEPEPEVFWKKQNVRIDGGDRIAILPNNSLM